MLSISILVNKKIKDAHKRVAIRTNMNERLQKMLLKTSQSESQHSSIRNQKGS